MSSLRRSRQARPAAVQSQRKSERFRPRTFAHRARHRVESGIGTGLGHDPRADRACRDHRSPRWDSPGCLPCGGLDKLDQRPSSPSARVRGSGPERSLIEPATGSSRASARVSTRPRADRACRDHRSPRWDSPGCLPCGGLDKLDQRPSSPSARVRGSGPERSLIEPATGSSRASARDSDSTARRSSLSRSPQPTLGLARVSSLRRSRQARPAAVQSQRKSERFRPRTYAHRARHRVESRIGTGLGHDRAPIEPVEITAAHAGTRPGVFPAEVSTSSTSGRPVPAQE